MLWPRAGQRTARSPPAPSDRPYFPTRSGHLPLAGRDTNPGGSGDSTSLNGVAASSSTNAWTVGQTYNGVTQTTAVEHWNGTAWKVQPSVNPGTTVNILSGVAATSTNAWAVGYYQNGSTRLTLIEHSHG